MPHEQSFLSSVLSVWEDQLTVMRLFFSLVHPLLRASGKDKTMKRIPKTPVEFDYDLWTTEDGKCMVRVKATGETTEVDREVMKALRNEEKKLRRSYDTGGASDCEDSEDAQPSTVLSLDAVPEDDVKASAWLESPEKMEEDIITGLLEQEFIRSLTKPQLDVYMNCISINDGYDSDDYKGTTGGLEVVMRSIIYAAYSKDLSVKTTTAKIQMMKQGKYVGGYAPYGYVLHPEIRNKLKLDPEAAEVVRRVFDEALEGRNTSQIALSLNDDNIPTPGQYFKGKHPDKKKYSRMSEKISWTASMVYKILTSYVYTGATVGHKRKSGGVGSRKTISQKKEEWIIVEGMHEAIVSKEEFELAQAVIRGGEKNPKRNLRYYPLKGLVCCGNCKRALTRRKLRNEGGYFYQCTYSTHDRDTECPVGERYSEAWIEDTAYKAIGQMLTLVEKKAVKEHEISKRRKSAITECADAIRDLQKQYEQLKAVKLRLYEKYTSGSITKAEYLKRKAETDAKMSENEEAIQQGHQRMQELDSEHPCSDERLDAVLGEYQKGAGLTYELAHALISAIYIHGHDSIEIVWQFKDIFEDAEI